ncbi:MAG: cyclic nucleotide-binding domain-containing protein [Chloroflexi bacterium]|nr:cyclic nucleotide-binding domain-containing protein [Chloroflexota bacterium]
MTDCAKSLRASELFQDITDAELATIVPLCREETFEGGSVIFHEGDTPDKMYIVEQGQIALDMALSFGQHVRRRATIEIVRRGQPLGWSAVAGSETFTATARCLERTVVLGIAGAELRTLFAANPSMGYRVQGRTISLVRSRLAHARDTLANILTVVSHDLRAPVHAVQSYHQVMLGGYAGPLTQQQKDMLTRSADRLNGLLGLIDDLLDISRIDSSDLEKTPQSLARIIESSTENVRPQAAEKRIELTIDSPADLPEVMAHPGRMQQLVTNLVSNAVKFTPAGGRICIRARAGGDKIRVEVMDTGPGIPPEDLPKVFDEFYRGQNAIPGGIGLGLSIAKKIIEAHNGRIWVESPYPESTRGAKFTFTLPRD